MTYEYKLARSAHFVILERLRDTARDFVMVLCAFLFMTFWPARDT